jgi:2-C-methyl-D-erythritol 4-phosphate cytidylyltransferase
MIQDKFVSVIISAAGSGTRMGTEGKLHLEIAGEAVLSRTLRKFSGLSWVDELILVVRPAEEAFAQALVTQIGFSYPVHFVYGGAQRHHSVKNVPMMHAWEYRRSRRIRLPPSFLSASANGVSPFFCIP